MHSMAPKLIFMLKLFLKLALMAQLQILIIHSDSRIKMRLIHFCLSLPCVFLVLKSMGHSSGRIAHLVEPNSVDLEDSFP